MSDYCSDFRFKYILFLVVDSACGFGVGVRQAGPAVGCKETVVHGLVGFGPCEGDEISGAFHFVGVL